MRDVIAIELNKVQEAVNSLKEIIVSNAKNDLNQEGLLMQGVEHYMRCVDIDSQNFQELLDKD